MSVPLISSFNILSARHEVLLTQTGLSCVVQASPGRIRDVGPGEML